MWDFCFTDKLKKLGLLFLKVFRVTGILIRVNNNGKGPNLR